MMDGMGMLGMLIWGVFSFLLVADFSVGRRCCSRREMALGQRFPFVMRDGESALDILNKRYASGEITKEEFQQMRKNIE